MTYPFKRLRSFIPTHILQSIFFWVLFIVNLVVTFYAFNVIPQNIAYDEILLGKLALSLDNHPYILFTSFADGHATPYFYIMLASFKLFGVNNFALRFPSALSGFLGTLVFYGIAKLVFKNKRILFLPISFIVGILFTCLRWRINFIRFSFEMPYLLLIELLSTYLVFQFTETKKTRYLILSGIFAGLAFHSYQPGRIFFIVPLIYLFFRRINIRQIISYVFFFLIVAMPLMIFLISNPQGDGRVNQLNVIQNSRISIQQKIQYISTNVIKTGLMFIYKGDANGRHNFPYKPAINPLWGLLLVGGLVGMIWNGKKENIYRFYFFIYLLIALAPALLTLPFENPHMLRTYTAIPSVIIFMGCCLLYVQKFKFRKVLNIVLLFIFLVGCSYELRTYFVYQARVVRNSFEVVCPIEKVVNRTTEHLGDLPMECRIHKNLF